MQPAQAPTVLSRRQRERRVRWMALAASVALHVVLVFAWRVAPASPVRASAAGPERGDPRAAAGAMQALNLRASPAAPVVPPPVPIAVEVAVEAVEIDDERRLDPADVLGDRPGLDAAPGVQDGTGGGDRGLADRGAEGIQPPSPRGMIIPPTNRDLRGTEVEVWVFVDVAGRVVPDSTRLEPPTRDRDFNRRLVREAAEWVFRPATREGIPVAAWFPYRIIM